jgi:hypothetical protein
MLILSENPNQIVLGEKSASHTYILFGVIAKNFHLLFHYTTYPLSRQKNSNPRLLPATPQNTSHTHLLITQNANISLLQSFPDNSRLLKTLLFPAGHSLKIRYNNPFEQ